MLLPAVTEFSSPSAPDRYARCARVMGVADGDDSDIAACTKLVKALHELNDALAVPAPSSCRISEADWFSRIPTMAEQALASGSPSNNPRVPSQEEIDSIYRLIWR
jgi:alcohol dehydrogenase class IV